MKLILEKRLWCAAFFISIILSGCGMRSGVDAEREGSERPPNIIFIMADDLGYGDLGSYGQTSIRTPNLDRMAQEGVRFTQYYAGSTVCAPSRSVLMTGFHTGHATVRNNVGWRPRGDVPLREDDITIADLVKEAGYVTGVYGKWALGLENTSGAPHRQGFDRFLGYADQTEAHSYYVSRLQTIEQGETIDKEVDSTQYAHSLIAQGALDFIQENQDRPFFLYLPFTLPHADLVVPDEALASYLDAEGNSIFSEPDEKDDDDDRGVPNATFAAMVSLIDQDVGRILEQIKALGLDQHTIVFFTSDNGPHAEGGHDPEITDSNGPLRGIKRDLYEGGIRVPMIVWGPGHVPSNTVSEQVWAAWDVLPTVAEFAGADVPDSIDGLSMTGVIKGEEEAGERDVLYWEFWQGGTFKQAVREGDWKAIRYIEEGPEVEVELYDLSTDMAETRDISDEHPEVVDRLVRYMEESHVTPELTEFQVLEKLLATSSTR